MQGRMAWLCSRATLSTVATSALTLDEVRGVGSELAQRMQCAHVVALRCRPPQRHDDHQYLQQHISDAR
eukprot:10214605-Alexandrium_andersonii.AAC.1